MTVDLKINIQPGSVTITVGGQTVKTTNTGPILAQNVLGQQAGGSPAKQGNPDPGGSPANQANPDPGGAAGSGSAIVIGPIVISGQVAIQGSSQAGGSPAKQGNPDPGGNPANQSNPDPGSGPGSGVLVIGPIVITGGGGAQTVVPGAPVNVPPPAPAGPK